MIKYNPKEWFQLIFRIDNDDTLKKSFPYLIGIAGFTLLITYFEVNYLGLGKNSKFSEINILHTLLGLVLSLLMVFRTNSAYDRWWEGRKLWGSLLNFSRNLSVKLSCYLSESDHENRIFFRNRISDFAYCLMYYLKDESILDSSGEPKPKLREIDFLKSLLSKPNAHIPILISKSIFQRVEELNKKGEFSGDRLIVMREDLNSFLDIMGACDRIKKSPIPHSYSSFIKKFIFIYTITLPIAHAIKLEYWNVFVSVFCLYVIMSLELLAEEIEDPFGTDQNDLPTEEISDNIRRSVDEIFT